MSFRPLKPFLTAESSARSVASRSPPHWRSPASPAPMPGPRPGADARRARRAAKELVALKGAGAMFDPLIPGVIESAKNSFLPTNPQLSQARSARSRCQLHKEYEPKRAELLELVAKIYAQHFTRAGAQETWSSFYKTPARQEDADRGAGRDQSEPDGRAGLGFWAEPVSPTPSCSASAPRWRRRATSCDGCRFRRRSISSSSAPARAACVRRASPPRHGT